jgi:uroporphyrinogen-III synthase
VAGHRHLGVGEQLTDALGGAQIVARGPKAAAALQIGGLEVWRKSPTEQMGALVDILWAAGRQVAVQEYGMESPKLVAI